jgi:hypothetical protein
LHISNVISEKAYKVGTLKSDMRFNESHFSKDFLRMEQEEQKENEFFREMTLLLEKPER